MQLHTPARIAAHVQKGAQRLLFRIVLPLLITGCGALGQTDGRGAVELARQGEYEQAADQLEAMVEAGDTAPALVESLYYSWVRQGLYVEARLQVAAIHEERV